MESVLRAMFDAVRASLARSGAETHGTVAHNPKGEVTSAFDAEAERVALEVALQALGPIRVFSEEMGATTLGTGTPHWSVVLDPCDGSVNFKRGVRAVGCAIAILPGDGPLALSRVLYGAAGDVHTGTFYYAARGAGTTRDGQPVRVSTARAVDRALLSVNLGRTGVIPSDDADGPPLSPAILRLTATAATVRRMGASVLDIAYVADGAYDGYIDHRDRLTPENFVSTALLVTEAGGIFSDIDGEPLDELEFTRPYNVIAAGTPELHRGILDALRA